MPPPGRTTATGGIVSKIKNISRTGWLVAGILAALLLVPTTAVAVTTATVTIIKGGTAAGQVSVTAAHQLLSTTASPQAYVDTGFVTAIGDGSVVVVASPPSGDALIVTTIHLSTYSDPAPGMLDYVAFWVGNNTGCTGGGSVGSYEQLVNPGSLGETDVPLSPGVAVPAGDALCAAANDKVDATVSAAGYTVPSSEVSAGPLHRVRALPRLQREVAQFGQGQPKSGRMHPLASVVGAASPDGTP
jgi:hypothetical protein